MSDLPDDQVPEQPAEPQEHAETFEDYQDEDELALTTAEFHNVIQKQIVNATYETLVETKLHWAVVEPFLQAARDMCRGDFRRTGRVQVHGAVAEGDGWADAEEAYLSVSIADQDDGREWLSETWWLSDLVLAGADPARVREAARALERSVAKLDAWLESGDRDGGEAKGPGEGGS